jgi:hypothetical protein
MLASETKQYQQVVSMILEYQGDFPNIPVFPNPADPLGPCWYNGMLPGLDAATLYALIAEVQPSRFVEIGSGHSTKFAAKAIADHSRHTEIVCIDPKPSESIDALCDRVIHARLHDVPIKLFTALEEGDIVFLNGSHVSHMHSDVSRLFLDILPNLRRGVLVQIHDVFLPDDYPREFGIHRGYNEQYLLEAYLLGGGRHVKILFPCHYVLKCEWSQSLWQAWDRIEPHWTRQTPGFEPWGGSFWMQTA